MADAASKSDKKANKNDKPKKGEKKRSRTQTPSRRSRSKTKRQMKEKLKFPVAEVHHLLAKPKNLKTVDPQVAIYLQSVIEYVATEIVELASNHALSRRSHQIDIEDVVAVIEQDPEVNYILGKTIER